MKQSIFLLAAVCGVIGMIGIIESIATFSLFQTFVSIALLWGAISFFENAKQSLKDEQN